VDDVKGWCRAMKGKKPLARQDGVKRGRSLDQSLFLGKYEI
jgi:hypothetical protein